MSPMALIVDTNRRKYFYYTNSEIDVHVSELNRQFDLFKAFVYNGRRHEIDIKKMYFLLPFATCFRLPSN